MKSFSVSNSVSNSFTTRAEQLITTCSHDLHTLHTELSTASQEAAAATKRADTRSRITSELGLLLEAICHGWHAGITGQPLPGTLYLKCPWNPRLEQLIRPYTAKAHIGGLSRLDELFKRGHHISQGASAERARAATTPPPQSPP